MQAERQNITLVQSTMERKSGRVGTGSSVAEVSTRHVREFRQEPPSGRERVADALPMTRQ